MKTAPTGVPRAAKREEAKPLLSVLLPAYNYPAGIARILRAFRDAPIGKVEVLVSDDSSTNEVLEAVAAAQPQMPQLRYVRNAPALGACANWNALLDRATGSYCLVMHHDEFPAVRGFAPRLLAELEARGHPDALVLRCVLVRNRNGWNREHAPAWLRALVTRRAPGYLFRRNVIGPMSVIVARRELFPRFDPELKWLVDVDAYYRLFSQAQAVEFSDSLIVGSLLGRRDSITSSIGAQLGELRERELRYLRRHYPHILGATRGLLSSVEQGTWLMFRAAERGLRHLLPSPVRRPEMRYFLDGEEQH